MKKLIGIWVATFGTIAVLAVGCSMFSKESVDSALQTAESVACAKACAEVADKIEADACHEVCMDLIDMIEDVK